MAADNTNQSNDDREENQDHSPDDNSPKGPEPTPPDSIIDRLGDAFNAGKLLGAVVGGATSGLVRGGIDFYLKNHGG